MTQNEIVKIKPKVKATLAAAIVPWPQSGTSRVGVNHRSSKASPASNDDDDGAAASSEINAVSCTPPGTDRQGQERAGAWARGTESERDIESERSEGRRERARHEGACEGE